MGDLEIAGYKLHTAIEAAKDQLMGNWKMMAARQILQQAVVTSSTHPEGQITLWLFDHDPVLTWSLSVNEVVRTDEQTLISMLQEWAGKIVEETMKQVMRQND